MDIDYLHQRYSERQEEIRSRLQEFSEMKDKSDKEIFPELAFCLLTPQSQGKRCWQAVKKLKESGLLFSGTPSQIEKVIRTRARFHRTKARHIVTNRKFVNGISLKEELNKLPDAPAKRFWLIKNIKGFGYKEASHFLRNTGHFDVAILDRHILKNLLKYGALRKMPKSLTPKKYLQIEGEMKRFAEQSGIPFAELDLLFWSEETGEVFK